MVPVVGGALGTISKWLAFFIAHADMSLKMETIQNTAIYEMAGY